MNSLLLRIFCIILCLLVLISAPLYGQFQKDIRFTTIDNTNGLPGNTVTSIIKDDLGFIWIGTSDGLCRYEGKNIVKIYRANQPNVEGGLENSNIRSLFLDSKKNLWIGTRLGGLTKFHQPSGTWKTYRHDEDNPQSISNDEILIINEDQQGRIWVGTEDGLNVLDPETEVFTSFLTDKNDPYAIKGKAVLSICIDDQQKIWVGTWGGGVNLLIESENSDLSKARFRQFYPTPDLGAKNIWKVYQDRQQRYWVGSRGAGLFLMNVPEALAENTADKNIHPSFYQYKYDNAKDKESISNDHLEDIYHDVRGNLWIGTTNGLNCIYSRELNKAFKENDQNPRLKFHVYTKNPNNISSINNNNVNTIFEDDQGLLWFGTYSGVSQYNWFTNQFEVFNIVDDISKTPNTQNLYVDKKGVIWFGFGDSGILKYDVQKNEQKLFDLKDGSLKDNYVYTLYSPDHEHLYIGTEKGVIVLNMKTNTSKIYDHPNNLDGGKGFLFIRSIFVDQQKRIWVGTLTGLYVINQETGISKKYDHHQDDPASISDNSVNQVYQDSNGDIWITSFRD